MVSIVILTYNKLDYTKLCIDSIRKFTLKGSYEIIVVDNNSTDGTVEWLNEQSDLIKILNKENLGFPKGCNQGIEIAKGEYILLLNNDTIVTENWLNNMLTCINSNDSIGAIGTVTNCCSNYQTISTQYKSIDEMHIFAAKHNVSNPKLWEDRLKLVGYCMLIRKAIVDRIGMLDERFTPGNFEDDDYSVRILKAGFRLVLCKDTFIHHYGSTSFKEDTGKYRQLLLDNQVKFEEKWGFNPTYSGFIRNEIVDMIDNSEDSNINVLEVGCACGATLLKIKSKYINASLFGIELNENAAQIAGLFSNTSAANIEDADLGYQNAFFDYIIFADVLEHLNNPWDILKNIKRYLKPEGKILASIPNVMHYSVLKNLLNGFWTYQDAGILDRTHLRFFTPAEINTLFKAAGYEELDLKRTMITASNEDIAFIDKLCSITSSELRVQYESYQILVRAMKKNNSSDNLQTVLEKFKNGIDLDENIKILRKHSEESIFKIIESSFNNDPKISNKIATKNYQDGKYDDVLPFLNKAFDIDKSNTDTLFNLSFVLNEMGEFEVAAKYINMIKARDEEIDKLEVSILNSIGNKSKEKLNDLAKKDNSINLQNKNECYYIDDSCDVRGIEKIKIGKNVIVQKDCWINIAYNNINVPYMIELGDGTNIGRRCTISAANKIILGKKVLLGPNILITDHNHEYKHVGIPIMDQGVTSVTNVIEIGDGTWIGTNCIVAGNVKIGKSCVIGGNSVVTRDIPDCCVAVGNPAKVVKAYDIKSGKWAKIKNEEQLSQMLSEREDLLDYIAPVSGLKSLQVEVSSACNLKCPQCFNYIPGHKTGIFERGMWDSKIKPLLEQLTDIHLVGIGEPLLCKDFFYYVEDSVKNNVKVHTTSNLQLVDEKIAEKLVTSGISVLSFSCDGADDETYRNIRVNGTLDKLKESLNLINSFKKKHNSPTPGLILNFGGMKSNIDQLPQVIVLAKTYNVGAVIAYHDVIYNEALKDESLFHYQQVSDQKFIEAKKLADQYGINMMTPGLFSDPIKHRGGSIYCSYPYNHFYIYSDGRVGPCCMDFPDRYILGELSDSTIEEVWNSKEVLSLRRELVKAPSYTCKYCVSHGKMDISDPRYFFRFSNNEGYLKKLLKM